MVILIKREQFGLLADGWNPLYEHIEDFEIKRNEKMLIKDESPIYINHYAKASNIFAANIYKTTGNIECGKAINTISIIMIFLFTLSFLLYKNKSLPFSLLFSLCVCTYPVICAQFLTNYLDMLVYVFLYLLIYSFFIMEEKKFIISKSEILIFYFMILTLCINLKVSLFGYAGIFCLGYYIWYIYRFFNNKIDKKFFWQFTIASIVSVIVGVFVIGLSVYPKNLIEHGHPFYPLIGEGKVDIMTVNQPAYFENKSAFEKFIISTFSKANDIISTSEEVAEFKVPFSVDREELFYISLSDTRISGNGIFFSGILIISLIVLIAKSKKIYKENSTLFILCAIPTIITFLMIFLLNESWWARYFPQIYFIVLFAVLALDSNKKIYKYLQYGLIFVILVNNFATFSASVQRAYEKNKSFNEEFVIFENMNYEENSQIEIRANSFHGAKYNILDKYKKYNITFKNDKANNMSESGEFFNGYLEWSLIK